jgi:tetrahydromethanopterin S-methyltransferase subunit F
MDNEPEVTREGMDATRASLSEKLETLEQHVARSVHDATDAVHETVEGVRDAVHDTVTTVRDSFDLPLQIKRHPWGMVAGSIALGYLGGYLSRRHGPERFRASQRSQPTFPDGPPINQHRNGDIKRHTSAEEASATKSVPEVLQVPSEPSWLTGVNNAFGAEIAKLKGLAIGTVLSVVRDMITQAGPEQMKEELGEVMDSFTVKLGGKPIRGSLFQENLRGKETNERNALGVAGR